MIMSELYVKQLLQLIVIYNRHKSIKLDEKSANYLIDEHFCLSQGKNWKTLPVGGKKAMLIDRITRFYRKAIKKGDEEKMKFCLTLIEFVQDCVADVYPFRDSNPEDE
jgi:hypothetical protein